MSRTIKLNRNQLINLISEMDWKTYANAAKKKRTAI